jgi:hypothetical protein
VQGQQSEWALLKRHPCEDLFGVQICGAHPDSVARCVQLLVRSACQCTYVVHAFMRMHAACNCWCARPASCAACSCACMHACMPCLVAHACSGPRW